MDLSGTGLQANILEALTEAGYDTAGKLVLTSKMDPDALLQVNGFGPKALERVAEFAEVLPELVPEPVEEEEPVVEQPAEEPTVEEVESAAEVQEEVAPEDGQPEATEAQLEESAAPAVEGEAPKTPEGEEGEEELSFDEMFAIKPEVFEPEEASEEEEEDSSEEGTTTDGKKKRKKKVKRFRELEYDPERDVVVAKKKHKRDGTPWNEWEE
jgi:N utilization substance protein A